MHKLLASLTGLALVIAALPAAAQAPAAAPPAAAPPAAAPAPVAPPTGAPGAIRPAAAEPTAPAEVTPPVTNSEPPPVVAPAPAPALPAPALLPPAAAPAVAADAAVPPAVGPDKLAVGKALQGIFQPSILLQFWGFYSNNPNITSGDKSASTFRIRRAEIRVKGDIIPGLLSYNVMIDPAKSFTFGSRNIAVTGQMPAPDAAGQVNVLQPTYSDPSVLQDYFITFKSEYADVSLGHFKIPVSYEGFNGSSKILFPERSIVARQYGDRRELGVKVEKKIGEYFFYSLGVFNGSGSNQLDNDNEKDVALRLEAYPVKGLTLAGVGYRTFGERDAGYRDRLEGDVRYEGYDFILLGEYIHAWDGPESNKVEGHGYYGTLGYTVAKKVQPVVRAGMLNPNKSVGGDRIRQYEAGLNYYLQSVEARAMLSVSAFELQDKPSANGTIEQKTRWEAILGFQAGF